MKFVTVQDIEAPVEYVFERSTDYEDFERNGLRAGARIVREGSARDVEVGLSWKVEIDFRNKPRKMNVVLTEFEPPNRLGYKSGTPSFDFVIAIELTALGTRQSRLRVLMEVVPNSLSARLLLQSIRLGKSALNRRFEKTIQGMVREVESDYASGLRRIEG